MSFMDSKNKIHRSTGIPAGFGYVVGGGYSGLTKELDDIVAKEAELLRDHFNADVTIRFNSDRLSGGAWLVDSDGDSLFGNDSIGLGAKLVNSKLRDMSVHEVLNMSRSEYYRLTHEPDTVIYDTAINLTKTDHSVPPDSKYIILDSEFQSFNSLEEAAEYLFTHVIGLKEHMKSKSSLAAQINSASSRAAEACPTTDVKVQEQNPER